jgi:esterase/lipase
MTKSPESFIFPSPELDEMNLKECKDNLIHIPTNRKNKDGDIEKIPCLFKGNPKSKNILIIFHCNGADMFRIFNHYSYLCEKYKINVLFPEYPGYSIYDSPLSSEKCLENSLIIYDYILNHIKNIREENIYILGRSLGTGMAVYLSSKRNPAGVILVSPYTTFAEVGKRFHSKEFYHALSNHLRSIDYIDKVKSPLFIIHGKADQLIVCSEAIKLYEKNNGKIKEIKLIEKMDHNNIGYFGLEKYIMEFINKYCPLDSTENSKENEFIFDEKELYILPDKVKEIIESI